MGVPSIDPMTWIKEGDMIPNTYVVDHLNATFDGLEISLEFKS